MRSVIAMALMLTLACGPVTAQTFPSKQVRIIVPYPAGGVVDLMARVVADKLGPMWGQVVIVDPKPGGNSNIATAEAARAAPDGYTLLMQGPAFTANPTIYPNLTWQPQRDFRGLGVVAWAPLIAVVPATSPAKTMKEFIDMAKRAPKPLFYANPGVGTGNHLATELLVHGSGIALQSVGYKGQPPALTDLIAGQTDFMFGAPSQVVPHIVSGKLRALGTLAPERVKSLPNVPTMAEAGFPDVSLTAWFGIMARAGTPEPVLAKLNADLMKVLGMPEVRESIEKTGSQPTAAMTVQQTDDLIQRDVSKWSPIIKAANIKVE